MQPQKKESALLITAQVREGSLESSSDATLFTSILLDISVCTSANHATFHARSVKQPFPASLLHPPPTEVNGDILAAELAAHHLADCDARFCLVTKYIKKEGGENNKEGDSAVVVVVVGNGAVIVICTRAPPRGPLSDSLTAVRAPSLIPRLRCMHWPVQRAPRGGPSSEKQGSNEATV